MGKFKTLLFIKCKTKNNMAKRKTLEQLIKENASNAEFLFQLKIEKAIREAYAQGYSDAVKALTNKVK